MKRIVMNADDFGFSIGTNNAIEKAFTKGVLTSTSIMPTGPAFTHAVALAKKNPSLGIGVHLSLTWGRSVLKKKNIPDLVDDELYFRPSYIGMLFKVLVNPSIRVQIQHEFEAQILRVMRCGIKPDHLNGQIHIHFLPYIFPIVMALAEKYSIPYVRVPLEPLFSLQSISGVLKWTVLQIMGVFIRMQVSLPAHAPTFFGVLLTSNMNTEIIQKIVLLNKYQRLEILTHPGEHLLGKTKFSYTKQGADAFLLSYNRLRELEAMLDKTLSIFLRRKKVRLLTFKDLYHEDIHNH